MNNTAGKTAAISLIIHRIASLASWPTKIVRKGCWRNGNVQKLGQGSMMNKMRAHLSVGGQVTLCTRPTQNLSMQNETQKKQI